MESLCWYGITYNLNFKLLYVKAAILIKYKFFNISLEGTHDESLRGRLSINKSSGLPVTHLEFEILLYIDFVICGMI